MNFLVDENMPRPLAPMIAASGHTARDVRGIGLKGRPDEEVFAEAARTDAVVVTRDHGFTDLRRWPDGFTAGVILVDLPADVSGPAISA